MSRHMGAAAGAWSAQHGGAAAAGAWSAQHGGAAAAGAWSAQHVQGWTGMVRQQGAARTFKAWGPMQMLHRRARVCMNSLSWRLSTGGRPRIASDICRDSASRLAWCSSSLSAMTAALWQHQESPLSASPGWKAGSGELLHADLMRTDAKVAG